MGFNSKLFKNTNSSKSMYSTVFVPSRQYHNSVLLPVSSSRCFTLDSKKDAQIFSVTKKKTFHFRSQSTLAPSAACIGRREIWLWRTRRQCRNSRGGNPGRQDAHCKPITALSAFATINDADPYRKGQS
jgi:hypothetical protein